MFLALRDLRTGRSRFVLVGVVVGLIGLLTTLLTGLATGLVDDGISGLRSLPLSHLAFQPGAESQFSRSTLTSENLEPWQATGGVESAPLGVSFFNARTATGDTVDTAVFGTPPDSFLIPGDGQGERLAREPGLVLTEELRGEGVEVGDVLTIVGPEIELPVVAFSDIGSYGHVPISVTTLETWQELVYGDNARGRFSAIALRGDLGETAAVDEAAGTETETKAQAYDGSPGFSAETATMTLIRGFLLVISALIVGAFFTVWTVQRTKQIGLLKALGASNAYILRDALGQLAIVLVVATAAGVAAAVGVGQLVGSGVPFRLQTVPVLTSGAILVVLGLVGCLTAVRKVTGVDPVTALTTEH